MQYVNTLSHIPPPETAKIKKAADVSENERGSEICREYNDSTYRRVLRHSGT
jgi:hypothetical protein